VTKDRELRESFVVRVWQEKDQRSWKGWVQHSRTGRYTVLQDPEELLEFIQAQICTPPGRVQKGLR
jgi:hypothetical protein